MAKNANNENGWRKMKRDGEQCKQSEIKEAVR